MYDLDKLKSIRDFGFDMETAVRHFGGYQPYFEQVNRFAENAKQYLRAYTPSVVVYSPEVRDQFLEELDTVRSDLISFGMLPAVNQIERLENAAKNGKIKILEDGLLNFYADMEILVKKLGKARRPDLPQEALPLVFAVDSKPEYLSWLHETLWKHCRMIGVTRGGQALQTLVHYRPDLFLLDVEISDMSGIELARRIRFDPRFRKTPLLFLSARTELPTIIQALQSGGDDYLNKTIRAKNLLEKIGQYLPAVSKQKGV